MMVEKGLNAAICSTIQVVCYIIILVITIIMNVHIYQFTVLSTVFFCSFVLCLYVK